MLWWWATNMVEAAVYAVVIYYGLKLVLYVFRAMR